MKDFELEIEVSYDNFEYEGNDQCTIGSSTQRMEEMKVYEIY